MKPLMNNAIFRALNPNQNPHRAAPAGPKAGCDTAAPAPRSQAEIIRSRSDLSLFTGGKRAEPAPPPGREYFTKVDDGAAMNPQGGMDATAEQLARLAADMQRYRAQMAGLSGERASSVSDCASTFAPATPPPPGKKYNDCSGGDGFGAKGVKEKQWKLMGMSTPQLRTEAQRLGNRLAMACVRGDQAGIARYSAQLQEIGDVLRGRSVPNASTDQAHGTRYEKALKGMSNRELNTEFSMQAARASVAAFRGDRAGAMEATKKLQAAHAELQGRTDNPLNQYMTELEGMSDADVVQANAEAGADFDAAPDAPAPTAPAAAEQGAAAPAAQQGGDDFGKVIASAAEMVKRSIEESVTAPFKFLGSLFGF